MENALVNAPLEIMQVPFLQLTVGVFEHVFFCLVRCHLILVAPEAHFCNHSIVFRMGMEGIYLLRSQLAKRRGVEVLEDVPLGRFTCRLAPELTGLPAHVPQDLLSGALYSAQFPFSYYRFRNEFVSLVQDQLRLSRGRRNTVSIRFNVSADIAGCFFNYLHERGVPLQVEHSTRLVATIVGTNTIRRLHAPAHSVCATVSEVEMLVALLGECPVALYLM